MTGSTPPRGPSDVLVAVDAIGVNFADTMVRRGEYRRDQPLAFTPGFEVSGRVLESPEDGPPPGATVVVFTEHGGGYADMVVAPRDHVFAVADGISSLEAAALFTQGVAAWYAVHRYGRVTTKETVLIPAGAGGLGSLCIQLCARIGATIVATGSTPAKLEAASGHGATHVILSDPGSLVAKVRAITASRGADVVIDGVGGEVFDAAIRALASGGRYVVVGSASQAPAMLDVRSLMPRGQSVSGFVVARVAEKDPAEPQRAFDEVQRLFLGRQLRPDVKVLPATQVQRAHELIESRTLIGKVVLDLHAD